MKTDYAGYFDYAAATPLDEGVFSVMQPFMNDHFYNPSALYRSASDVRHHVDVARVSVAEILGVKSQEIIFTGGCTEANNLAIRGVMDQYPEGRVFISAIEHDSVLEAAQQYACGIIPVDSAGVVDLEAAERLISDDTVLVSCMYANNEIGTVQPLRKLGSLVEAERKRRGPQGMPIYLHTDAAQAANYFPLLAHSLKVDMVSLNSGKIYGPKGAGCLYVGAHVQLRAQQLGGGQERGLRSGTEHVAGIVGFAEALRKANTNKDAESARLLALQTVLVNELSHVGGHINGSLTNRLPNNVHVGFDGQDNERLVLELDRLGFMVSSGSACHARSGDLSRVLSAIGLSTGQSRSSIRISMGRYTTGADVERLLSAMHGLIAKNR